MFLHDTSSPEGFVTIAEGFSPATSVWRHQTAAGLKPSAPATKAGTQRVPGGLFAKPCITPRRSNKLDRSLASRYPVRAL